jgi:hypothetical protein
MRQFLFVLAIFSLFLNSPQTYARELISKGPRILKLIPVENSRIRLALDSLLKHREIQLLDFKIPSGSSSSELLRYARFGVDRMTNKSLVNRLKIHQVFDQGLGWNSDVLKSLYPPKEQQIRCSGCTGSCPRGVPCFEPTPAVKIRKILSLIPEDQTELREELGKILDRYKSEMRELSAMNSELTQIKAATYAQIGLDGELSEEMDMLLKSDLASGGNMSWKEEVQRIVNEDKEEELRTTEK